MSSEGPPEERMAVGHMGSWTNFDQSNVAPQVQEDSTDVKPDVTSQSIEDAIDLAKNPEQFNAVLDSFEFAFTGEGEAECHAELEKFFQNSQPGSKEAVLVPLSSQDVSSQDERALQSQSKNTGAPDTTSFHNPNNWRRWTAIHLTTLPAWCEKEYTTFAAQRLDAFQRDETLENTSRLLPPWPVVVFAPTREINSWKDSAFYHAPAATTTPSPASITGDSDWAKGAQRVKEFRDILEQFVPLPQPSSFEFVRTLQRHIVSLDVEKDSESGGGSHYLVALSDHGYLSVRGTLFVLNFPPFQPAHINPNRFVWRSLIRKDFAGLLREHCLEGEELMRIGWNAIADLKYWAANGEDGKSVLTLVEVSDIDRLFSAVEETGGWRPGLSQAERDECLWHMEVWKTGAGNTEKQQSATDRLWEQWSVAKRFQEHDEQKLFDDHPSHHQAEGEKPVRAQIGEEDEEEQAKKKKSVRKKAQAKRAKQRKRDVMAAAQAAHDAASRSHELSKSTDKNSQAPAQYSPLPIAVGEAEDLEQSATEQTGKKLQATLKSRRSVDGTDVPLVAPLTTAAEAAGNHRREDDTASEAPSSGTGFEINVAKQVEAPEDKHSPQPDEAAGAPSFLDEEAPGETAKAAHSTSEAEIAGESDLNADQPAVSKSQSGSKDGESFDSASRPFFSVPKEAKPRPDEVIVLELPPVVPALPNYALLQVAIRRSHGLPSPKKTREIQQSDATDQAGAAPRSEAVKGQASPQVPLSGVNIFRFPIPKQPGQQRSFSEDCKEFCDDTEPEDIDPKIEVRDQRAHSLPGISQPFQVESRSRGTSAQEIAPISPSSKILEPQAPSRRNSVHQPPSVLNPAATEFIPDSKPRSQYATPAVQPDNAEAASSSASAEAVSPCQHDNTDIDKNEDASSDKTVKLGLRPSSMNKMPSLSSGHLDSTSSSDDSVEFLGLDSVALLSSIQPEIGQTEREQSTVHDVAARPSRLEQSPFRRPQPLPEGVAPAQGPRLRPLAFERAPLRTESLGTFLLWWIAMGVDTYHAGQA